MAHSGILGGARSLEQRLQELAVSVLNDLEVQAATVVNDDDVLMILKRLINRAMNTIETWEEVNGYQSLSRQIRPLQPLKTPQAVQMRRAPDKELQRQQLMTIETLNQLFMEKLHLDQHMRALIDQSAQPSPAAEKQVNAVSNDDLRLKIDMIQQEMLQKLSRKPVVNYGRRTNYYTERFARKAEEDLEKRTIYWCDFVPQPAVPSQATKRKNELVNRLLLIVMRKLRDRPIHRVPCQPPSPSAEEEGPFGCTVIKSTSAIIYQPNASRFLRLNQDD